LGCIVVAPLKLENSPKIDVSFLKNAGGLPRGYRWSAFLLRVNRKMVFIHY
jgi:hypothetical protein